MPKTKSAQQDCNLVLVLGDQLTPTLSSLKAGDSSRDIVLMAEVMDEATYVPHHKKKLALIFGAMRHFRAELDELGWTVEYTTLNGNCASFTAALDDAIARHKPAHIIVTEPGEWRVLQMLEAFASRCDRPVEILPDDRFISSRQEFAAWAEGRKQLRMEYFYREMRKKTGLLMDGDQPEGGRWNYDSENRKPASNDLFIPKPAGFTVDSETQDVLQLVSERFPENFGDLEPFRFAVTRKDAEAALDHFIKSALPSFGSFQDAMLQDQRFLYHSVLSPYINIGLLDPLEVCRRAAEAYDQGHAPLNAVEGFIRQIIGWREYMRGIYWLAGPGYVDKNFFGATRRLPEFYWTGETDMACLKACITQTREEAYAHHIQRLMVTGNFAMLAGVDPKAVHEWYLLVYADAFEWVELPNTLGMSQFADGGFLGSKPYAAGGNYINKMSDYCGNCRYKVKEKTGEDACPFNYLYWDFLARNQDKLQKNPRLGPVYRTWARMEDTKRAAYRESAESFLDRLT
ncbi:MAG: cryptochrome/photolyase family protein [Pseudomonadota bacterium]